MVCSLLMSAQKKVICLFDIDGTLSPSRLVATPETKAALDKLRSSGVKIGCVGGSDFAKQQEQLGSDSLDRFDYSFPENGLVAYKVRELIGSGSIAKYFTTEQLNKFVSFTLRYIADLDIPVKTGTFFELRTGLINICPIGRNCTYEQRLEFFKYDQEHHVRATMIEALKKEFPDYGLHYSIGGQISFDVFPEGWTKVYCLRYVEKEFDEIHFFGDMTQEGGNDYEIAHDPRVHGHTVKNPEDTVRQFTELFLKGK